MANRLPSTNEWQDGDVLTASDLNDTLDVLENGVDTVSEEVMESRRLLTRINFQTSNTQNEDAENSLTDLATNLTGYENRIQTTDTAQFNSGTIDGFHYPKVDLSLSETVTDIPDTNIPNLNSNTTRNAYHPIQEQVFAITSINSTSTDVTINYNIVNHDGSVAKSGSVTYNSDNADIRDVRPVIDNAVVFQIADQSSTPNNQDAFLYDFVNDTKIDSLSLTNTSDSSSFLTSGVRNQGGNSYGFWIEERSGIDVIEFEMTDSSISQIDTGDSGAVNTSTSHSTIDLVDNQTRKIAGGTDFDFVGAGLLENNNVDYHARSNANNDDNGTSGFLDGSYYIENTDTTSLSVEYDLFDGAFRDNTQQSVIPYDLEVGIFERTRSYTTSSLALLKSEGQEGYVNLSNRHFASSISTSADSATVATADTDNTIIDDDNDKVHFTFYDTNNSRLRISTIDLANSSITASSSFLWESEPITHKDTIEYINTDFGEVNQVQGQYKIYDIDNSQELGPFNTGEKVYIGDKNTTEIKIRLDKSIYNTLAGIRSFTALTW